MTTYLVLAGIFIALLIFCSWIIATTARVKDKEKKDHFKDDNMDFKL